MVIAHLGRAYKSATEILLRKCLWNSIPPALYFFTDKISKLRLSLANNSSSIVKRLLETFFYMYLTVQRSVMPESSCLQYLPNSAIPLSWTGCDVHKTLKL